MVSIKVGFVDYLANYLGILDGWGDNRLSPILRY